MPTPHTERYDAGFYADQVEGSARSAAAVLPRVFGWLRPAQVVDVGCGHGAWLAAAGALGATTLTGLDGAWVDRAALRDPRIAFHPTDLAADFHVASRHDLCLSVEVAEHLPVARAEPFVAALCAAADAVLFSAAVPFQGGTEHVNEERASRWSARFDAQGFDAFDLLRPAIWDDTRVAWWYRQNLLLFAKRGTAAHAALAAVPPAPQPRDLVHPDAFEEKMRYLLAERVRLTTRLETPTLRQALGAVWRSVTR